ncbi:antibiotic biosynthesis monooxygenase family protein [Novosphingobium sp. M1R2S20]|uniref:Antibiotic biosynthesis monooxygenase n=1 Tax=Novosphingobium rhizovicinum TaxID=3228928 RepID=A0ABV3RDT9_9SPHN
MFLVVFRNRKRADIDGSLYARDAGRMAELAARQPGYLSFKSYTAEDGEVVAVSEWADEASARAWGRHIEHHEVQARGRASYYEEYTLFACAEPHILRFNQTQRPTRNDS